MLTSRLFIAYLIVLNELQYYMSDNTVVAYNFLAALSETKRDLFKNVYVPFCKRAMSLYNQSGRNEGKDDDIKEIIQEYYGLDIPIIVVRQLIRGVHNDLSRFQKKESGFKIFENGHSFQMEGFTFKEIEDKYKSSESESVLLQDSFESFKKDIGIQENIAPLSAFIDDYRKELTSFFAGGNINLKDFDDESYLIHIEFLEHIQVQYHVLYKIAEKIFLGSLIASYLEANIDLEENFARKVEYYIDTELVLKALDLQIELETQPTIDLFELIKKTGGELKIFEATVDEICQVLEYAIEHYDQNSPITTINEACIRLNKNKSWLIKQHHNIEQTLKEKFGFKIEVIPPSFKNEIEKLKEFSDLKELRSNKSNAFHDVLCYRRVRFIRGGSVRSTKKAKAWFVASNRNLYRFNREYIPKQSIGEIVTPEHLTALLWLTDVNKLVKDVKKTGLNEIISRTISEEVASKELIASFEKNLKSSPNVSEKDYEALISTVAHESAKTISKLNQHLENEEYEAFNDKANDIIERDRSKKKKYIQSYKALLDQNNLKGSKISDLLTDKEELVSKISLESERADKAEERILEIEKKEALKKWRWPARYLGFPILILLFICIFLFFFYENKNFNFITSVIKYTDLIENETRKSIMETLIYTVLFAAPVPLFLMLYHFYFNKEKIKEVENR